MNPRAKFKKILFVLYQFPPSNDVGAQRPIRFIKHLGRYNWQAIVMAPSNGVYHSYDDQIEELLKDDCIIYRVPMFFPSQRFKKASTWMNDRVSAPLWRVWNRMAMPDGVSAWLIPAVARGIRIALHHDVDVLLASGQPFSTFTIASLIQRTIAKPLLLDYRDPWTLNPFYKGSRWRNRLEAQIEKYALRTAAAAIFTTEEAQVSQKVHFEYPGRPYLYRTIPNSFEKEPLDTGPTACGDDKFRLIHAGNLYGSRNPVRLFEALAWAARRNPNFADQTRVMFFGVFSAARYQALARRMGIAHMVEFGSRLPRSELEHHYRRAGGLLLINSYGRGHHVFIPSKFFDYLKIGLPILCLTEEGALKNAVDQTRSGIVVDPKDSRAIAVALLSFYQRLYLRREPYRPNERAKARYEASHTTQELVQLCEEVINRQR